MVNIGDIKPINDDWIIEGSWPENYGCKWVCCPALYILTVSQVAEVFDPTVVTGVCTRCKALTSILGAAA